MSTLTIKNRYLKRAHISERKTREIVRCFAQDLPALTTARLTQVNRNTINRIYRILRLLIAAECEKESPFRGEIEVDESYFGPKRVPGKRGRGAKGKTIVFGILKRGGKVYTQIVPDVQRTTLQQVIRGKVELQSVIYRDSWRGYNGLVDVGYDKHLRVKHGEDEFVDAENPHNHINGIESFWSYTKRRLQQFNGISKSQFHLFLKASEFRFNHRDESLHKLLLKLLRTSLN